MSDPNPAPGRLSEAQRRALTKLAAELPEWKFPHNIGERHHVCQSLVDIGYAEYNASLFRLSPAGRAALAAAASDGGVK